MIGKDLLRGQTKHQKVQYQERIEAFKTQERARITLRKNEKIARLAR